MSVEPEAFVFSLFVNDFLFIRIGVRLLLLLVVKEFTVDLLFILFVVLSILYKLKDKG